MQFQAICSKWSKKLTLSINAGSLDEAKKILHWQGYSIIDIKEITEDQIVKNGNFFYFDVIVNGINQSGKIQSDDIFKAYRKLVEDLKYKVQYIYTIPNATEDQKKIITAKVKDGYRLYIESIGGTIKEEPKKDLTIDEQEIQEFSPQLLRELEKYGKLIDETIEKVQNFLIKNHEVISWEQKAKLETIELELAQIKGTKNFGKIQSVLEDSLKGIGVIELDILKKGMVKEKEAFLSETNKLLKEIGSGERIQTEEQKKQTVEYQLGSFFEKIKSFGSRSKDEENTPSTSSGRIDTTSFIYLKNKRELDIYKKSLSKNTKEIISSIFSFQFKNLKRLFLKRKLLTQNIQIIDNRIKNKNISYTKIIHGIGHYNELLFSFISWIATLMLYILFTFCIIYITLGVADSLGLLHFEFVNKSVFIITIFALAVFLFQFVRGWLTLFIVTVLLLFITGFLLANF